MKPSIQFSRSDNKIVVRFEYEPEAARIMGTQPRRQFRDIYGEKWWELPFSQEALIDLTQQFSTGGYRTVFDKSIQRDMEQLIIAKPIEPKKNVLDNIKIQKESTTDFSFLKLPPFPYQKNGIDFIAASNYSCIVADQPGVGKTLQGIGAGVMGNFKHILVISPEKLKKNWMKEIVKCTDKTWAVLYSGDEIDVKSKWFDFTIINYDLLTPRKKVEKKSFNKTAESLIEAVNKGFFDCVIIDEGQKFKNKKTGWTKFILEYLSVIPHRIILTGTPIKSRPIEFWTLLRFIDPFTWGNEHEYALRYCGAKRVNMRTRSGLKTFWDYNGASNLAELNTRVAPIMIRRLKSDVMHDLPPKLSSIVPVELSPKERAEYNKIENDLRNIRNTTQEDFGIIHALRQFTTNLKQEAAIELIDSIISAGEKVIVFAEYVQPLVNLLEHYGSKAVILTGDKKLTPDVEVEKGKFQENPECQICLGSPASYEGHTLTAASTIIRLTWPWTPSDLEQGDSRAHRSGQKDNVTVYNLVCEETIDARHGEMLEQKSEIVAQAVDGIEADVVRHTSIMSDLIKEFKNGAKRK